MPRTLGYDFRLERRVIWSFMFYILRLQNDEGSRIAGSTIGAWHWRFSFVFADLRATRHWVSGFPPSPSFPPTLLSLYHILSTYPHQHRLLTTLSPDHAVVWTLLQGTPDAGCSFACKIAWVKKRDVQNEWEVVKEREGMVEWKKKEKMLSTS